MRRFYLLLSAAVLLAAACNRQAAAPAGGGPAASASASASGGTSTAATRDARGDAAARTRITAYAVELLRRYPTVNTYLGGGGLDPSLRAVDGMLRDYSPAAVAREDEWLGTAQRDIQALDPATLSDAVRIDREVALAQIAFLLRQHQVRHYQERSLDTYVAEPFRALDWQLQGMSQTGDATYGSADEWRAVISRVKAIPRSWPTRRRSSPPG